MASTSSTLNAESYHLKWDSHASYMNLSVSTLYKNEKFADVMLLSSHPDCIGGPGIPAHKIILSTSSKFFSSIFDLTPQIPSQNGLMYLVLPPELSRRAIQVLVQYMYSGESTVSNEILNEVLRGGEILKIRGLCRNRNRGDSTSRTSYTPNSQSPVIVNNNQISTISTRQPIQSPSSILPLSNTESNRIIKTPFNTIQKQYFGPISGTITVKKDIAIDPDNRQKKTPSPPPPPPPCEEQDCSKFPPKSLQPQTQSLLTISSASTIDKEQSINLQTGQDNTQRIMSTIINSNTEGLLKIKEEPIDSMIDNTQSASCSTNIISEKSSTSKSVENSLINDLNLVKKEIDKHSDTEDEVETSNDTNNLKVKNTESEENLYYIVDEIEEEGDEGFEPLACDTCNEKFTIPQDWVKHMETHEDVEKNSTNYVPKKKRKMEIEARKEPSSNPSTVSNSKKKSDEIATLQCELCHLNFDAPGEWVRHMQNSHTETELAINNQKSDKQVYAVTNAVPSPKGCLTMVKEQKIRAYLDNITRTCSYCKKEFPSYKDMVVHLRAEHLTQKYTVCDF